MHYVKIRPPIAGERILNFLEESAAIPRSGRARHYTSALPHGNLSEARRDGNMRESAEGFDTCRACGDG
ncbi:hypothetical protein TAMA11512_08110 [Selenomonas sp. TAMA-11512]|nr:hypothetical protein TAMA11512_08110 [Selenomonas sp. TAMA-11512]